jgi:hypothetical protein
LPVDRHHALAVKKLVLVMDAGNALEHAAVVVNEGSMRNLVHALASAVLISVDG